MEPEPPLVKELPVLGWQCPPKSPSQRGTLQSSGLRHPSKKPILKSSISAWAVRYPTRRTGIYKLTFPKEFLSHSSCHRRDVFPVNPAPDLSLFLWIPHLNTTSSIPLQTFKWNDFAASRRTKFPLIPENPSHAQKFKKSLTTGTSWLWTTWVWWVIKPSPA